MQIRIIKETNLAQDGKQWNAGSSRNDNSLNLKKYIQLVWFKKQVLLLIIKCDK